MNRKKMLVEKQEEVEKQIEVTFDTTKSRQKKTKHECIYTLANLLKYQTRSVYIKNELCPLCPKTLNQLRQERNQLKQELEKKTKDKADRCRREEEKLREAGDKDLEMGPTARPKQNQLEKRVEQLEKQYKCLYSGLETEMEKKKAEKAKERVSSCKNVESSLHKDNESDGNHLE